MRKSTWMAAVALGLSLAAPAWAQRTLTFGGANSTQLTNVPIDTSGSSLGLPQAQLTRPKPPSFMSVFTRWFSSTSQANSAQAQLPRITTGPDSSYMKAPGSK